MTGDQLAFPWQGETKRPTYLCDWFDFLSAYARVHTRFTKKMQEFRAADAQSEPMTDPAECPATSR